MEWALQLGVPFTVSAFVLSQCSARRSAQSVPDVSLCDKPSESKESTSVSRRGRVHNSPSPQQKPNSNDSKSAPNSDQTVKTEKELHPQRTQTSVSKSHKSHKSKKTARKKKSRSKKKRSKRVRKTPNETAIIRTADSKPSNPRSNERRPTSQPSNGKLPRTRTEEDDEALHSSFLERRRKANLARDDYDPQKTQTIQERTRHSHERHDDTNQRMKKNKYSKGAANPHIKSVATQDDRTEDLREVHRIKAHGSRDVGRAWIKQSAAGSAATAKTPSKTSKMEQRTQDQDA